MDHLLARIDANNGQWPNYTSPMQTTSRQRFAIALLRFTLAALLLCSLSACGNKGPLVMPNRTSL
ncbi:MAG: lipoprotein [Lysobacteraceae bacterium]